MQWLECHITITLIASSTSKIISMHSGIITVFSSMNIKQNYIVHVCPCCYLNDASASESNEMFNKNPRARQRSHFQLKKSKRNILVVSSQLKGRNCLNPAGIFLFSLSGLFIHVADLIARQWSILGNAQEQDYGREREKS